MGQIKNIFSLRSTCHFSRSLHDIMAADVKTTYFEGKTKEFVGEWVEGNNLSKLKSVFKSIF